MSIVNILGSLFKNNAQRFEDWTVQVGKQDPAAEGNIDIMNFNEVKSFSDYKDQLADFSEDYIKILDKDGDGKVSYDEFEKHNIDQAKENIPNISENALNQYKETLQTIYGRLNLDNEGDSKDNLDLSEVMNYFFVMDACNGDVTVNGNISQYEYETTSAMLADKTETGNKFAEVVKQFYEYLNNKKI